MTVLECLGVAKKGQPGLFLVLQCWLPWKIRGCPAATVPCPPQRTVAACLLFFLIARPWLRQRASDTSHVHIPANHPEAAVYGTPRAAPFCSPTTWKWAQAPRTPPPSCAPLAPSPWKAAYVQPSRRPKGRPPWREPQPPAALLPVPGGAQARSGQHPGAVPGQLGSPGHRPQENDIRFVEDDWENPRSAPGAWAGKSGSTAWEVTQFTYFQQVGGIDCRPPLAKSPTAWSAWPCTCRAWTTSTTCSGWDPEIRRRLPPERSGAVHLQLRALRRRLPVLPSTRTKTRAGQIPDGAATPAWPRTCSRPHTFNLLDARRHQRDRACCVHRPHPQPGPPWPGYYSRERLGFPASRRRELRWRSVQLVDRRTTVGQMPKAWRRTDGRTSCRLRTLAWFIKPPR